MVGSWSNVRELNCLILGLNPALLSGLCIAAYQCTGHLEVNCIACFPIEAIEIARFNCSDFSCNNFVYMLPQIRFGHSIIQLTNELRGLLHFLYRKQIYSSCSCT
jgi:hypothetical protein